jgi:hypothetical protein
VIEFGDWVEAPCKLLRRHGLNGNRFWLKGPRPVSGMYIGWRTYSNGKLITDWGEGIFEYDEVYYKPEDHFKVALIVPNERAAPVAVMFDEMVKA